MNLCAVPCRVSKILVFEHIVSCYVMYLRGTISMPHFLVHNVSTIIIKHQTSAPHDNETQDPPRPSLDMPLDHYFRHSQTINGWVITIFPDSNRPSSLEDEGPLSRRHTSRDLRGCIGTIVCVIARWKKRGRFPLSPDFMSNTPLAIKPTSKPCPPGPP